MAQKVEFLSSNGDMLAARLDKPSIPVKAYALFAHCFTCSKDIFAASRIARALTGEGIAVLRFDFTGLGDSEGEFANTTFSSNIEDLVAAAQFLQQEYEAPQLLIGHSLGGTAVIAAAHDIPSTRAVVTIGAPFDVDHILKSFSANLDEIKNSGKAQVNLAGRDFTIKSEFVENAKQHSQKERLKSLKKPLLIFHSPVDESVSIDNATEIFIAAKHPKSFVSLDKADHLLTDHRDAVFVANILAAWAMRYMDVKIEAGAETQNHPAVKVEETGLSKFQQKVTAGSHVLLADEPKSVGGQDTGPSPYDYLSIALGACSTMTMRMYAEHKGYDIGKLSVEVSHAKVHAEDCADCGEGRQGRVDRFERTIGIEGDIDPQIAQKLVKIADRCPVHKTLEHSSVVATKLAKS